MHEKLYTEQGETFAGIWAAHLCLLQRGLRPLVGVLPMLALSSQAQLSTSMGVLMMTI
jgi:hypothetical protein